MKSYRVIIAPVAAKSIDECALYIAEVGRKPETAAKWVSRVYDRIASLEVFPQRHALAQENGHRDYEIRQQIIGNYVVLYSIDEDNAAVHIIGAFARDNASPARRTYPNDWKVRGCIRRY